MFCLISVLDTPQRSIIVSVTDFCLSTSSSRVDPPESGVFVLLRPVAGVLNMHQRNDDRQAQSNVL